MLSRHLQDGEVFCHEFVIGELACGNLKNRGEVLSLLRELPLATVARNDEVLHLVESHRLFGKGIGWIDAHLLAATRLSHAKLWTLDKRLGSLASVMDISL